MFTKKLILAVATLFLLSGCNGTKEVETTCPNCGAEVNVTVPEEPALPCPDTRNGDFNPAYSTAVCNANGYFWCSLAGQCLNKPINVSSCGEMGSAQRDSINSQAAGE